MEIYKLRMIIEYQELKKRTERLGKLLDKHLYGELDFELNCPVALLESQYYTMQAYLSILAQRAAIEHVDLDYVLVSNRSEEEWWKND